MATFTTNLGLVKPISGQSGWGALYNANWDRLDALAGTVGQFAVRATDIDATTGLPTSRAYAVAAGTWVGQDGRVQSIPARSGTAPASATTCVWHDGSGDLATGPAFPAVGAYLPLAAITADASKITAIADRRAPIPFLRPVGPLYRSANYASTSQAFEAIYSAYYFAPTVDATLTLPSSMAGLDGLVLTVVKIDAGAHTVTIAGNGNPINGASTYVLSSQWQRVTLLASEFVGILGWVVVGS